MQLTKHIYLVASGDNGLSLTSFLDCNVYWIETGDGAVLIDAGAGFETEKMDQVVKEHGLSYKNIKSVFLTHYHADHSNGVRRIQELSGCRVYIGEKEAKAMEECDEVQIGLKSAIDAGYIYPPNYVFHGCSNVEKVFDEDCFLFGNIEIKAYTIAGHSLQDMLLYTKIDGKACLFTGDAVFADGKILLQNLPDVSIYSYSCGLKKLENIPVDAMFPGHGEMCLNRGNRHIKAAVKKFDSLLLPPQIL